MFEGGDGGFTTSAVAVELALAEPAAFEPVTVTRSVEPMSPEPTPYVFAVAETMSAQVAPAESQRRHWYAMTGPVPDQPPAPAVRTFPTAAVPVTVGSATFA